MKPLQVIALQMNLSWQNPESNREKVVRMLSKYQKHADIILLPEMFTTGFTMEVENNFEEVEGPTSWWLQELARERNALVGGSVIIREKGSFYNRFLLVSPDDDAMGEYDKRHLFRMADEHDYFEAGEEWTRVMYKGWRILPQVCYDLRFPVWSRNRLDGDNNLSYDLMLYVANWPAARSNHWKILLQARAIENLSFVMGVNRVGEDGKGIAYSGDSMILDPRGNILAHNEGEETILEATLDPAPMLEYREKFPAWRDADVFELYV